MLNKLTLNLSLKKGFQKYILKTVLAKSNYLAFCDLQIYI